jgi:hypothetical protein
MNHKIESFDPHSGKETNTELLGDIIFLTMPRRILEETLGIINYELKSKYFDVDRCEWVCTSEYGGEKCLIPYNEIKTTQENLLAKFN